MPRRARAPTSKISSRGNLNLAGVNGARGASRRAGNQERRALDLLDVVETRDAHVAVREGSLARLALSEDFVRVGAAVHGELPHNPVAVVIVTGVDGGVQVGPAVAISVGVGLIFELDARSPAVVQQVLHLLGDFGIGERRQEGEGLKHPIRRKSTREQKVSTRILIIIIIILIIIHCRTPIIRKP